MKSNKMHFLDPDQEIEKQVQRLPHWQQGEVWIFVTWRLGDSLPQSKLKHWKGLRSIWLEQHPRPWCEDVEREYDQQFGNVIDDWLDAGFGSCCLAEPPNAEIVANALLHFNDERYSLSNFVVMPNHVHVLFRPLAGYKLSQIVGLWKSFTAKKLNQRTGKAGSMWQANYWDRLIRSAEHLRWTENYIQQNPSKLQAGRYYLWRRSAGL